MFLFSVSKSKGIPQELGREQVLNTTENHIFIQAESSLLSLVKIGAETYREREREETRMSRNHVWSSKRPIPHRCKVPRSGTTGNRCSHSNRINSHFPNASQFPIPFPFLSIHSQMGNPRRKLGILQSQSVKP